MAGLAPRLLGLSLVLGATVLWSTAGIFVRLVDLDVWSILGWRSVFAALALMLIVALKSLRGSSPPRSELIAITLLTVPMAVVSMGAYVVALKLTTVANVMVVYATVPLVTAGVAWLMLREKITARIAVASLAALAGVVVMTGAALAPTDLVGVSVAILMTLAMGTQIVMARKYKVLDMALVNAVAAAICAAAGLLLAQSPLPTAAEMLVLCLFGVSNTALAYLLLLIGAHYIPSAEVGLISTIDVVLGPLWVWLLFSEQPAASAVWGGAIVLAAVLYFLLGEWRDGRPINSKSASAAGGDPN